MIVGINKKLKISSLSVGVKAKYLVLIIAEDE